MLDAGLIASRFLHYVAVLSLFGAALFPVYVFRGRLDVFATLEVRLATWLRRLLIGATLLAFVTGIAWFIFTTALMAGGLSQVANFPVLRAMMHSIDFGPLWTARLVLTVAIALLLIRWPSKHSLWIIPLLAAFLLGSLAGTGHTRVTEGWAGALHVVSDATHLIAAGLWLGGLWPLGAVIVGSLKDKLEPRGNIASVEVLRRFSGVGTWTVAVLVGTGVVNSYFLVGSPFALISSTYGQLLTAKIALFLLMALLASINRFLITPKLSAAAGQSTGAWLRRLRLHVAAEQTLGLFVLGLVSLLGTFQPAVQS